MKTVLFAALLLFGTLVLGGCKGDPPKTGSTTTPTSTATPVPAAALYSCPPEVGAALCEFAARAEAWVQAGDVDRIVAGSASDTSDAKAALAAAISETLAPTPSTAAKLRSISCLVVKKADTPEPDCSTRFGLTFATITHAEITASPHDILVLAFGTNTSGPVFETFGVPVGPGRIYVMTGPLSDGCKFPGTDEKGCLGYRIFPVEVLAAGQQPAPDHGSPETIAGIHVRKLALGNSLPLPPGLVVYLTPAPYATDSNPLLLKRVYRDPSGNVRRDDLIANLEAAFGPLAFVSALGDEHMGQVVVTACPAGRCRGTGVGGWAGEFDVYRSMDGGVTWSAFGHVPAMNFPAAIAGDGVIMRQFVRQELSGRNVYRFFEFPSGREISAPAPFTEPRVVPGLGLIWEPTYRGDRNYNVEPTYDAAGNAITLANIGPNIQPRLIAKEADGSLYVAWMYVPDRPADPHPMTFYLGRIDASGKLTNIYSSTNIESWLGPYAAGPGVLVGNANLQVSGWPPDVPAVLVDLATGTFSPMRELAEGLDQYQQPFVFSAVRGPVARVAGAGDCLNVREQPSKASTSLGCFRDGVLLQVRGQAEQAADGITWVAVETPDGRAGWASGEFLER